jgi:Domain of unknown function (DUF4388)
MRKGAMTVEHGEGDERASGEADDDLVELDGAGHVRPLGPTAAARMSARQGTYRVLPAPAHLLVMRRGQRGTGESGDAQDERRCLLSGEIHALGALCDIVSFLGQTGWRGELVVIDRESSRSLFFDQGNVAGAQSTVEKERLGRVLYRYGVLTDAQLAQCSEATSEAIRFGEVAVSRGFLSRDHLFSLMGRQSEEIFYGALLVGSGTFYFLETFEEAQLSSRQSLSVGALVREGVRRMHETRYFRARIPSDQHVPARRSDRAPPTGETSDVYAAVDGVRSVADICRLLARGEFEVSRTLFQLVQAGQLAMKAPRVKPEASVLVYNRVIALILRELDAMDEGDELRAQLATWIGGREVLAQLLAGAGPLDDGTLDAARVAANVAGASDRVATEDLLARGLYDYASYALFLARPHTRRAEQVRSRMETPSGRLRLSQRVAAMLEPIAPARERPRDAPK